MEVGAHGDSLLKDLKPRPDENAKDRFGATKALREAIEQKYEITSVIGKGSYGCVSRGICKTTGREVALKIMINQTTTEYDSIKVLREIQLMQKLDELSDALFREQETPCERLNGRGLFLAELIDIISPPVVTSTSSCPSSDCAVSPT